MPRAAYAAEKYCCIILEKIMMIKKVVAIATIVCNPKKKVEAKEDAVIVLKIIKALGEQFPVEYTLLILTGKATPQVKMYRHEELNVFASGNDKEPHFWNSLIRQMLLAGLIEKDIVEYGLLKFTKKGEAFKETYLI